ncbi:MAG TPA: helix-turn-helix domain-containing protein [Acidimicrobiales bacterium]|nr:helix-turn-helix domain-containing protein [Acidimicrobiales bacterium]
MPKSNQVAPVLSPDKEESLVFPPTNLDVVFELARFLEQHRTPARLIGPDGREAALPDEVYRVLCQVAEEMRGGNAILVAPKSLLLTTQEAADFLGISRPTFVKLLEKGEIPYQQPNRHRRVQLKDLVDYQARRRAERRAALNQMTEEASELGLHDERADAYTEALRKVRSRRANR